MVEEVALDGESCPSWHQLECLFMGAGGVAWPLDWPIGSRGGRNMSVPFVLLPRGSGDLEGPRSLEGSGDLEGPGSLGGSGNLEGAGSLGGSGDLEGAGSLEGSGDLEGPGSLGGSGNLEGSEDSLLQGRCLGACLSSVCPLGSSPPGG